ncbi:hypothetical protein KC337_g51 [Hortaea werneckii]|nr:hypothetical protein KC337_g51 [Hortaea werneckii]
MLDKMEEKVHGWRTGGDSVGVEALRALPDGALSSESVGTVSCVRPAIRASSTTQLAQRSKIFTHLGGLVTIHERFNVSLCGSECW